MMSTLRCSLLLCRVLWQFFAHSSHDYDCDFLLLGDVDEDGDICFSAHQRGRSHVDAMGMTMVGE